MNPNSWKKGSIIAAYVMSPPRTQVICIDEMGPRAVKTYPDVEWLQGDQQATLEPDYVQRGKLWARGAFEPATGQSTIVISPGRDSLSHIRLIETVMCHFPADYWLLIEDNLSIHTSRQVKLVLAA